MNRTLQMLIQRGYLASTDGESDGGGGDRGDDFTPTDDTDSGKADADEGKEGEEAGGKENEEAEGKEGEAEDKPKEKVIPKARFDEAQKKAREREAALTKRLEELEARSNETAKSAKVSDLEKQIDELDDKIDAAIADGNKAEAKQLRAQQRKAERELQNANAARYAVEAQAIAVERVKFDALIDKLEAEHPILNPEHEDFDEEFVAEMLELKAAYEARGLSSTEAVKKAIKLMKPPKAAEAKKDEPKAGEETLEEKEARAAALAEERRAAAAKKAAEASGKQPPNLKDAGKNADKAGGAVDAKAIMKMSDAEFDKLTPEQLKKMRGD